MSAQPAVATAKPTLRLLARELGLSVTTVSRALAGYPDVARATRERVRETAARLGYVPNSVAKMLVTGQSGFVGFVLTLREPAYIDPWMGEFLSGLGEGLAARGRYLFVATVSPGQDELEVLRQVVESGRADAIVLSRVAERDRRVAYLVERGVPFVTHGRTKLPGVDHRWVDTDGEAAFAEAVALLFELGHRRFALLSIEEPMTFRGLRERGLARALAERPRTTLATFRTPRFDVAARARAIDSLLDAVPRPTAVLALTDDLALALLERAAERGVAVPEALSVIGFDDLPQSGWVTPALTTFAQRTRETALALAGTVADAIDEPSAGVRQELLRTRLVLRDSHGPAPADATAPAQSTRKRDERR